MAVLRGMRHPEQGPRLMSFGVGGKTIGLLVATIISGWILSHAKLRNGTGSPERDFGPGLVGVCTIYGSASLQPCGMITTRQKTLNE